MFMFGAALLIFSRLFLAFAYLFRGLLIIFEGVIIALVDLFTIPLQIAILMSWRWAKIIYQVWRKRREYEREHGMRFSWEDEKAAYGKLLTNIPKELSIVIPKAYKHSLSKLWNESKLVVIGLWEAL
jgi:hypothetical protein